MEWDKGKETGTEAGKRVGRERGSGWRWSLKCIERVAEG